MVGLVSKFINFYKRNLKVLILPQLKNKNKNSKRECNFRERNRRKRIKSGGSKESLPGIEKVFQNLRICKIQLRLRMRIVASRCFLLSSFDFYNQSLVECDYVYQNHFFLSFVECSSRSRLSIRSIFE